MLLHCHSSSKVTSFTNLIIIKHCITDISGVFQFYYSHTEHCTQRINLDFSLHSIVQFYSLLHKVKVVMLFYEFKLLVIGIIFLSLLPADGLSCEDYKNSIDHEYHPLRHCQKSNKTIIGSINVNTVDKCADYASKRKAMAFNFAPSDRGNKNLFKKLKGREMNDCLLKVKH